MQTRSRPQRRRRPTIAFTILPAHGQLLLRRRSASPRPRGASRSPDDQQAAAGVKAEHSIASGICDALEEEEQRRRNQVPDAPNADEAGAGADERLLRLSYQIVDCGSPVRPANLCRIGTAAELSSEPRQSRCHVAASVPELASMSSHGRYLRGSAPGVGVVRAPDRTNTSRLLETTDVAAVRS